MDGESWPAPSSLANCVCYGVILWTEQIQEQLAENDVTVRSVSTFHECLHSIQPPFEQAPTGFMSIQIERDIGMSMLSSPEREVVG